MTTATSSSDFWSTVFPTPQPTQDTDLLSQVGFVPGLKEVLMLRQVHALEHATVWALSDRVVLPEQEELGGLSTDRGFYLYGQVKTADVSRAASLALRRITQGEWNLAVHPRCGTNVSVGMLLIAGFALGASALLPRGPIEQILGLGFAATTAAQLTPELGRLAQQYVTTAIPFNLTIQEISVVQDYWGRPAHFVQVHWVE
ncbi:MAG: hypothetical protein HC780_01925 [Leptolyngbyaceae cyanobacterium CSU_1_3]|nr:hypothetical protein [Leptolyngbyaceae cyanobacterium CSU_1_3]